MYLPKRDNEFILMDAMQNCYYFSNGVLHKKPLAAFDNTSDKFYLPQHPDGAANIQISFTSNQAYWMNNRSFTVPLTFITDGAEILKQLRYNGRGFSEQVWLLVISRKQNSDREFGTQYFGQIDMAKVGDDPFKGVTTSMLDGGLSAFFATNNTTSYDIPCDESVSDIVQVLNDGQNLSDSYYYKGIVAKMQDFLDQPNTPGIDKTTYIVPFVFQQNEGGDSVGILSGNPSVEKIADDQTGMNTYAINSSNYFLSTQFPINNLPIRGELDYKTISLGLYEAFTGLPVSQDGLEPNLFLFSQTQFITLYAGNGNYPAIGNIAKIPFSSTVSLAGNEKLFLAVQIRTRVASNPPLEPNIIEVQDTSNITLPLTTRNTTTIMLCRRPVSVGQDLVDKMTNTTGVYKFVSNFLTINNNIVTTCGDAIRQTSHTVVPVFYMTYSFQNFFQDYSAYYCLGVKIVGKTLYVEPKADLNNIAGGVIFNLGSINLTSIDTAEDLLFSKITNGSPDQSYDLNAGKYEYNSTQERGMPTTATDKVLDISTKSRTDGRGIERIRGALLNKDTTDNSADKQVFMVDISDLPTSQSFIATKTAPQEATGQQWITFDLLNGDNISLSSNKYIFNFTESYQRADFLVEVTLNYNADVQIILFKNGQSIATYGPAPSNGQINLMANSIPLSLNDNFQLRVIPTTGDTYTIVTASIGVTYLIPVYPLYRRNFTSLTGVLDNTIYNERLSPLMQVRAWGGYIKSVFYQQLSDTITFNTGAKNILFSRTLQDGTVLTENASIVIGNLPGDIIFLPYIFKFTAENPAMFNDTLAAMGAGYITKQFNGLSLNSLPIGDMLSKPLTNEPQEWSLLAAPNNSLSTFLLLDKFALTLQQGNRIMYNNAYNPISWAKYNYQTNYNYKGIYDDWQSERFNNYTGSDEIKRYDRDYWQTSDTIKDQWMTSGEGVLTLFIYDADTNKEIISIPYTITPNQYVTTPFVLQQVAFTLDPGYYLFVVKNGAGESLIISNLQDVKTYQPKTYAIDYTSSYNVRNTFFNTLGVVRKRIRAEFAPEEPNGDDIEYQDEGGNADIVHSTPIPSQELEIGGPEGISPLIARKIDLITRLNGLNIEGYGWVRQQGAKMTNRGLRQGYPFSYYTLVMQQADNDLGLLLTTTQDVTDNLATSFIIDFQVMGESAQPDINVNIQNT